MYIHKAYDTVPLQKVMATLRWMGVGQRAVLPQIEGRLAPDRGPSCPIQRAVLPQTEGRLAPDRGPSCLRQRAVLPQTEGRLAPDRGPSCPIQRAVLPQTEGRLAPGMEQDGERPAQGYPTGGKIGWWKRGMKIQKMVRNYKRTPTRGSYGDDRLSRAVKNGDSVNKASGDYGVPRRTLDTSEAWSDNRAELQWAAKQQRCHRYSRLNLSSTRRRVAMPCLRRAIHKQQIRRKLDPVSDLSPMVAA
ncbi:hypothetical protein LSAT2_001441 [Lamellibrachia satsuma]|nr:hypothetical protein LSAT2_001441 [Lamellibrachia satsuma]